MLSPVSWLVGAPLALSAVPAESPEGPEKGQQGRLSIYQRQGRPRWAQRRTRSVVTLASPYALSSSWCRCGIRHREVR